MMKLNYVVADVFTAVPLSGNPVAIFTDARALTAGTMQRIAREMQLSETVFVLPPEIGGDFCVRIFTPVNELPFAGHPTLGTAIVMGETFAGNGLRMETGMGIVPFRLDRGPDGRALAATMQQPIPTWETYDRANILLDALGLAASALPVEVYHNGPRHVFVGLESIQALSQLQPDHRRLAALPDVAINCFAGSNLHWRSRMFSPAYGVVEDAATGSAAGPLAIHLGRHGYVTFGQTIDIHQGVEMGRPSLMRGCATVAGDRITAVSVSGEAVVIMRGTMQLPSRHTTNN
ncbi:PhzF family phenazine biosynthesis protein (plasmid) [Rhizobium leguminosarum]|uniref:PhzF family phenazine biosynthesis protein n=1 Tax=Rhizobium leguminosarum TaxID=384 RepID=UPI000480F1F2|nr:PhzF family phenazine biosynthesis protein [Rhizobium leguminosarum]UIK01236.1 PhzF family phenazine biosynthesis protein [Rhizobium leguminosarum]UIK14157.1 PhzF family phenazine biosynthesis protein [Rhizobium leguminosarum]UIL30283.1 PhzF family phenazine biosynthesis protein [Rhizobium leguminosarum]WFT90931.1 PhzF family phenazine biosynthesis protein [Rhizobium leguminosarum]